MEAIGYLTVVFAVMSIIAVVITVYDKLAAKSARRRVPEKALMLVGFLGGAIAMYAAMQLIRHKTKHKKFMIGLPIMILLHIMILTMTIYF